jgi:hypothetical protein
MAETFQNWWKLHTTKSTRKTKRATTWHIITKLFESGNKKNLKNRQMRKSDYMKE